MIKTREQAARIQRTRQLAYKRGMAKAVRRFIKRTGAEQLCDLAPLYRG